jgi:hypothetical protein
MATDIPNTKLLEQLRSKCRVDRNTGCWVYTLSSNNSGYANTRRFGRFLGGDSAMVQASRLAYAALKGPIPDGHEADHLCKNKLCLNPHHLESVPASVNRGRNRVAEPHPLSGFWFAMDLDVVVPRVSDTGVIDEVAP